MRLTITHFNIFLNLSFLLIGLFNPYLASAAAPQERSLVPVPDYSDYGGYYPDCSSRSYPYPSSEVCYRWVPGYYKYHRYWIPGYWRYQRVWVPGYWKYDKKWVEGHWETRYYGQPYRDYYDSYKDFGYYSTQDYRATGMPPVAPDAQKGGSIPYGYFDSRGVWVPYQK